jgi:hypothetical protein
MWKNPEIYVIVAKKWSKIGPKQEFFRKNVEISRKTSKNLNFPPKIG